MGSGFEYCGEKQGLEITAYVDFSIFIEFLAAYENRLSKRKLNLKWLVANIWMTPGDWTILHKESAE